MILVYRLAPANAYIAWNRETLYSMAELWSLVVGPTKSAGSDSRFDGDVERPRVGTLSLRRTIRLH